MADCHQSQHMLSTSCKKGMKLLFCHYCPLLNAFVLFFLYYLFFNWCHALQHPEFLSGNVPVFLQPKAKLSTLPAFVKLYQNIKN